MLIKITETATVDKNQNEKENTSQKLIIMVNEASIKK